mmetsp:Transcript_64170/g.126952  ORF Transcript_64170/g.126952 Transcript_64170/m.126952 type:complete len:293 (+) Transcript_64170:87-965(+)
MAPVTPMARLLATVFPVASGVVWRSPSVNQLAHAETNAANCGLPVMLLEGSQTKPPAWLTGEAFINETGGPVHRQGCLQRKASLVMDHVPVGATVLEMGARFGVVTCAIARKVGPKGHVIAVEPDKRVWPALEHNLKNFCPQVELIKGAVANTPLRFSANTDNGLLSHTVSNKTKDAAAVTINTVKFAELESKYGLKFDTVWADCQGCFHQFLAEQHNTLAAGKISHVVLEEDSSESVGDEDYMYSDKQAKDYKDVEITMGKLGFSEVHRSPGPKDDGLLRVIWEKASMSSF